MTSRKSFRRPTRRVNPNPLGASASITLKQHESMVIEPSLFGDCHGDYSAGLFYGGRRKFLKDDDEKLKPPSQFMTNKQKKNQLLQQKAGKSFSGIAKLEFTKRAPPPEVDGEPYVEFKRAAPAKKQESTITIEKYPSINPADWEEVKQAGCTFYLHTATGELSPEKPWVAIRNPTRGSGETSPARSEGSHRSFQSFTGGESFASCEWEYFDEEEDDDEINKRIHDDDDQWGCGSLAYDGKAMGELLSQLEGIPWGGESTPR